MVLLGAWVLGSLRGLGLLGAWALGSLRLWAFSFHFICYPGPLGQSWARELKGDKNLQKEYSGLPGRDAKKAFRMKWAGEKLEVAKKRCVKETKEAHEQETLGVYLPFKVVVDREGGDDAAFEASLLGSLCPCVCMFVLV